MPACCASWCKIRRAASRRSVFRASPPRPTSSWTPSPASSEKSAAMCGLFGYLDLGASRAAERWVLEAMGATLRHRGPDSVGYFTEAGLGLGFCRLRIIDLEGGEQPMHNEDGSLVLACNGEIFNYVEIREEQAAGGHRLASCCDVEVLLHLYEDHG